MPEERSAESVALSHEITTRFTGQAAAKLLWQHVGEPNPAEAIIAQLRERLDRLEQVLAKVLAGQEEVLQTQNRAEETRAAMDAEAQGPSAFPRARLHTIAAFAISGGVLAAGYLAYALLFV